LAKNPEERPRTALVVAERLEAELRRLRADPDYCGLGEYVDEQFDDVRDVRQQEILVALDAPEVAPGLSGEPQRRGLWATLLVLFATAAAAAVALGWWVTLPGPEAVVAKTIAPPEVEEVSMVVVDVTTTPAGARIVGAGIDALSPASFTLEQGDTPVELEIRRRGYRTHTLHVTPNAGAQFDITLDRSRRRRRTKRTPRGLSELWD
jgi:hypothetical protein